MNARSTLTRVRAHRVNLAVWWLMWPCALLLAQRAGADVEAKGQAQAPSAFSAASAVGGLPAGWRPFTPSTKLKATRYALVRDGNTVVVRADAEGSMSGLIHPVRIDPAEVAVGMPVTRHPPHRSVRAELPHTAPASGHDAKRSDG